MRFSLATIVLVPRGETQSLPDPETRKRLFAWAVATGFHGVEFSSRWMNLSAVHEADLHEMRGELQAAGLIASGMNVNRCILTRTDRAGEHLALVRRAIDAAVVLQAPLVTISLSLPRAPGAELPVLCGSEVPDAEHQAAATLVAEIADQAGALGGQLSLELHDDGLLDSPELCLRMLDRVGRSNVGLNPDLGNICRNRDQPGDWRTALAQLAPFANCWHVKNYRGGRPASLDDGDIDYACAVAMMQAASFDGPTSIESYFVDVLANQVQGLAYLKRITEQSASAACRVGLA